MLTNRELIDQVRQVFVNDGRISTHYVDCYLYHPQCALAFVCSRLEEYVEEEEELALVNKVGMEYAQVMHDPVLLKAWMEAD